MDLVDIDSVLDNLELNEEEHRKENIPIGKQSQTLAPDVDVHSQPQLSSTSQLNKCHQSINYVNSLAHNTMGVDRLNKFVGVSQVFSSLDDYRKNVETLDLYSNNKNNDNTNYNNLNNDKLLMCKVGNAEVDDDKEESKNEYDDEDLGEEEYGFSSNSITTSSSSTFSSGPSPALISTDSEPDSPVNVKDDEITSLSSVAREINKNLQSNEDENTINYIDSIQPNELDSYSIDDNNRIRQQLQPQQRQGSDFDDLAIGLSSISLSTQQDSDSPASALASGSIKIVLNAESLSSSLSISKTTQNNLNSDQKPNESSEQKFDEENTISSELPILENYESVEGNIVPTMQPHLVTFSSTMDDISDTELDSILQEIDSAMTSQHFASQEEHVSPAASSSGSDCDEIINKLREVSKKDVKTNVGTSSCNSNLSLVYQKNIGDIDGMMNVDSFSQASTLELTEDRADIEEDMNKQSEINVDDNEICDESESKEKKDMTKRQRPTTLNLPVRKINLYSTAGQTPPGSRIYDHTTSSSDEETPEDQLGAMKDVDIKFNDDAGHTPPDRPDRAICFNSGAPNVSTLEISNVDVPVSAAERIDTETNITSVSELLPEQTTEQLTLESTENTDILFGNSITRDSSIGKVPPIWVPDQEANACMQCQHKFTLLKRRHHCRACGRVLCSVCCSQKFKLAFLSNLESRVCVQCFLILTKLSQRKELNDDPQINSCPTLQQQMPQTTSPNPNNPMEYCSTIPPHRQVNTELMASCPTVIVPVGVLKKKGNATKSRKRKSVMFSDGIRPGSDLATLDCKWSDAKHARKSMPRNMSHDVTEYTRNENNKTNTAAKCNNIVLMDDRNGCYIPTIGENTLPPVVIANKSEKIYQEVTNNSDLINRLQNESLKFVIQNNFFIFVKISHLKCCINKTVINFTTCGLNIVGNDEIIILLELDNSNTIPKDIFVHLNEIYWEASRGHPITELGFSMPKNLHFLGSREHGGFLFIRPTFQCLLDMHVPAPPFLIGVLIHRWEMPWAKIFPLRLMLRLGAHYRYYPSPHISVREREPVYGEIAQTIINLLADFRNYTYTIPTIKGMYIHMEDRRTNILIPRNRLDEVIKAINNSSDHILAMGANFSKKADGHLVCIQNIKLQTGDSLAYSTQAINIQGQPRKVTGASFFVFNEALKSTSGLSGKCSIIEDGLMVQILPSKMAEIRHSLANMKDIDIVCGPINAEEHQSEVIHIQWVDDDVEINIGVRSPIDSKKMDGIPSIRVHSGINLSNNNHILKWTEVFIIEISEDSSICKTTFDVSKVSEQIARNASIALLPFLDLLVANGSVKIGLRVTLTNENVCYEAGSQNEKLPPLYMNALDNELIQTLNKQANDIGKTLVLELIFHILNVHTNA